ncbi:bacterial regulatory helix-turn-helix, lysR family protein, partial [Vibrio parahaemolyticus VP2007-007]
AHRQKQYYVRRTPRNQPHAA